LEVSISSLLIGQKYSGDHAPLEYIAIHSIVLQCTVYRAEGPGMESEALHAIPIVSSKLDTVPAKNWT